MTSPTEPQHQQSEDRLTLQFFLDASGTLAGAHTVGLAATSGAELLLPMSDDTSQPDFALTVGEVHDQLYAWAQQFAAVTPEAGVEHTISLEADGATLTVTFADPVDSSALATADLPDSTPVRLARWTVSPGPRPLPLAEGRADELGAAVNGLRLASGSVPLDESTFDFSPGAQFSVATPMVQALSDAVRAMGAPQLAAWHVAWMEVVEGGYRSDVALATCDALARRTGRGTAWQALFERADQVARDLLGADGPSELLMETCVQLFEQVGVEDEETRHLLLGRIAVVLHDQVRALLLTALVEDVAPAEITVPPLQAWWSGQTLAGIEA
jgi:hypothetical protein